MTGEPCLPLKVAVFADAIETSTAVDSDRPRDRRRAFIENVIGEGYTCSLDHLVPTKGVVMIETFEGRTRSYGYICQKHLRQLFRLDEDLDRVTIVDLGKGNRG